MDRRTGVEGRGGHAQRRIGNEVQQFVLKVRAVDRDVPQQRAAPAAKARLPRRGLLRHQRLEAGGGRGQGREVRRLHRTGDIGVDLSAVFSLPQHADAWGEPVIGALGRQVECGGDAGEGEALVVAFGPAPCSAADQGQPVGDEQPTLGEDVQGAGVLVAAGGVRALEAGAVDPLVGVQIALPRPHAVEGVRPAAERLAPPVDAAEQADVAALLIDHLEDGVVQVLPAGVEAALENGGRIQPPAGLEHATQGLHVPAIVQAAIGRGGLARIGQGLAERQAAGDLLVDLAGAGDQPNLAVFAKAAAEVQRRMLFGACALVAPAVHALHRQGAEAVPVAADARRLDVAAHHAVGAAVEPEGKIVRGGAAGRGEQIDRAAQQGPAEAQGVAAFVDLSVAGDQRIDQLKVAKAVRLVERHAVLGQQHAAIVDGVADPRPPDRQPYVAAPLLLGVDAGRVAQEIGEVGRVSVLIGLGRDNGHRARRARQARARLGHHGRILGVASRGDDDAVELCGGLGGEGLGDRGLDGRRLCGEQQRPRRRHCS